MSEPSVREIAYGEGETEMLGHLALPADDRPRPGILVVHEWWGRNDYACRRAEQLAALGYVALAIDMYGGARVAQDPDTAGQLMNGVVNDMGTGRARFEAAMAALRERPEVDSDRVGAIGYCFGGGVVLHMARAGVPLDVVASFHGSAGLGVTAGPDTVNTRVVVYNGEQDVLVPAEELEALRADMAGAGAPFQLVQLPGALHGFSNPQASINGPKYGLPLAYDRLADEVSWGHLQMTLSDVFGD